jgi:hypothetical protein
VLQDLHSTIYLSNYETVMTRAHNMKLELKTKQKNLRNKQKVNKQVSFNIIKNRVMDLFLNDRDVDEIIDELNVIFNTNTTQERELRTNSRKKTTTTKSLNFNKRKKKSCF